MTSGRLTNGRRRPHDAFEAAAFSRRGDDRPRAVRVPGGRKEH
jgi:hypothetical protein